MPRKLNVYRTHIGFDDLIVAAPSQKAALQAWGASPHLFAQGFAAVTDEPALVEAALAKPGVVLRRQFGTKGEFKAAPSILRLPPRPSTPKRREPKASRPPTKATARESIATNPAAEKRAERERIAGVPSSARQRPKRAWWPGAANRKSGRARRKPAARFRRNLRLFPPIDANSSMRWRKGKKHWCASAGRSNSPSRRA